MTVVDEKIVGCALSIIVNYDDVKNDHTYAQVTARRLSTPTIRKATYFMASKSLSIPNTVACVWHAVCMNTARNFARH